MNLENLRLLRDHIDSVPEELIDMRDYSTTPNGCDTAHCIAGWAKQLMLERREWRGMASSVSYMVAQWLEMDWEDALELFEPPNFRIWGAYTKDEVLRTLDHLLATGEIKWT